MSERRFDILGLGVVAVDDILRVNRYPAADQKEPVVGEERVLGGLVGRALAAASRLGGRCAYVASLGADDLSAFATRALSQIGVNVSLVRHRPGAGPVHSVIITDITTGTRNIFFDESRAVGPALADITADLLQEASVLVVDHVFTRPAIAACEMARQLGIPTVGDIEGKPTPQKDELAAVVDHLIVPRSFAAEVTGAAQPEEMARLLHRRHPRSCTAVTCGSDGCFFAAADGPVRHQPAYRVPAVDTTGCGDVFHGAYAWALSQGRTVAGCIETASAAAAAFAARPAGWSHLPSVADVAEIIRRRTTEDLS